MQDTAPGQDLRIGEALADWIARRAHPIGLGTLARARWAVVDLLGCAIAGRRDASVTALTRCAKYLGNGDISALGTAYCYPAPVAALIGGTSAHVLDYDDTGATSIAHVSAVAVPCHSGAGRAGAPLARYRAGGVRRGFRGDNAGRPHAQSRALRSRVVRDGDGGAARGDSGVRAS